MTTRERLEPRPPQSVNYRVCDWCGNRTPRDRIYCGSECQTSYNALLGRQGKSLMQMLKIWRRYRGRKNTRGQGLITEIALRVDALMEEDRERQREPQEAHNDET